jgi:hypothetical protein
MGLIRGLLHVGTLGAVAPYNQRDTMLRKQVAIMQGRSPAEVRYVGTRRQHSLMAYAAQRQAQGAVRPQSARRRGRVVPAALSRAELVGCGMTEQQARDYLKKWDQPARAAFLSGRPDIARAIGELYRARLRERPG